MNDARLKEIEDHICYMVSTDDRIDMRDLINALRETQAREATLKNAVNAGLEALRKIQKYSQSKPIEEMATDGITHIHDHANRREALKEGTKP